VALEKKGYITRNGRTGIQLTPESAQPRGVPLLHVNVGAGPPGVADPTIDEHLDLVRNLGLDLPTTFLLPVRGVSMVKRGIQNGDIVVVRPDLPLENGDVAAVVMEEDAIVKTVHKKGGQVSLFSEPQRGGLRKVAVPQCTTLRLFGRVVAALRFLKQSPELVHVEETRS
jgi:repressor LexA